MPNRIDAKFAELKSQKRKAFIAYLMAGDPDLRKTPDFVWAMEDSGVDIIELGMPFTDPVADGAVIQDSALRSLKSGTNLRGILRCVEMIRRKSEVPILLMGYYNPVFHYGLPKFFADAKAVGVDGFLIVDLPPEESEEAIAEAKKRDLSLVFLLDPTSDAKRIGLVSRLGRGFHYYITVTGVTGAKISESIPSQAPLKQLRQRSKLPICLGFGIKTPEQAAEVAPYGDGVVVGSAIVDFFKDYHPKTTLTKVRDLVEKIARAIHKV